MSHLRVKTTYNESGNYGSTKVKTLYAHHNLSGDVISFYDETGECILVVEDIIENNLLDAINRIYFPHTLDRTLEEKIEYMNQEDCKICGI